MRPQRVSAHRSLLSQACWGRPEPRTCGAAARHSSSRAARPALCCTSAGRAAAGGARRGAAAASASSAAIAACASAGASGPCVFVSNSAWKSKLSLNASRPLGKSHNLQDKQDRGSQLKEQCETGFPRPGCRRR